MRNLTASVLNINEAQLTIDVLDKLARLSAKDWAVQLIVVASPSSCWLVRQEAQQGVASESIPMFWICCDDK